MNGTKAVERWTFTGSEIDMVEHPCGEFVLYSDYAALAHMQQAGVVVGYVLVPVEPTEAMQDAGWRAMRQTANGKVTAAETYRAMLAAAGRGG